MPEKNYKYDFPIFRESTSGGRVLAYLDAAAMAQMPKDVIEAICSFDVKTHANVHRGIYGLSEDATAAYEEARAVIARFVGAASEREIVFTRNTTESINVVASALRGAIDEGDRILVSRAEHHSNILPWRMLAQERGAVFDMIDPDADGIITLDAVLGAITETTRLVALSHVSHVLGTINPIAAIGAELRRRGILFLVDAAQSVAHLPINVREMNCDFLAFSGHKMGGPTGIGVLYGREKVFETLPPVLTGGGMVTNISDESVEWADLPAKFEAGTPNITGAIGLAAAAIYIMKAEFVNIERRERGLVRLMAQMVGEIPGIQVLGPADLDRRGPIMSFTVKGIHPHDLATILDRDGVAVRAGHHCAMPLHRALGLASTVRAGVWVYNDTADIMRLADGIKKAQKLLRGK